MTTTDRYAVLARICKAHGWALETLHDPGLEPIITAKLTFSPHLHAVVTVEATGIASWVEFGDGSHEAYEAREAAGEALRELESLAFRMRLSMLPVRWRP